MKNVLRSTVHVTEEQSGGWRLAWDSTTVEHCETAVEALEAVRSRDRMLVEGVAKAVVTSVVWEPRTSVGRAVVKVLVGGER